MFTLAHEVITTADFYFFSILFYSVQIPYNEHVLLFNIKRK